jgi:hypothetical protein
MAWMTARGAGVTLVTHGFSSSADTWVLNLASAMAEHPAFRGTNIAYYDFTVTGNASALTVTPDRIAGVSPLVSDSGEIFIQLDWGPVSSTVTPVSTSNIAAVVAAKLMDPAFLPELGGRALAELPLHVIGHSRGASLVAEITKRLGQQGVWVDHVTFLDPHPLNNDGNTDPFTGGLVDASAAIYENVFFADNYWQTLNLYPQGRLTPGAANRKLTTLGGGYTDSLSGSHSDTHLWYFGTVNLETTAFNGDVSLTAAERNTWWTSFEQGGTNAGFVYSRIARGNRFATNYPAGNVNGNGRPRDGVNQKWNLGAGVANNRVALGSNSGAWPSPIRVAPTSSRQPLLGTMLNTTLWHQAGALGATNVTVTVALDADGNPWNSNSLALATLPLAGTSTTNVLQTALAIPLPTDAALAGRYQIAIAISNGTRTRHLYATEPLVLVPGAPPLQPLTVAGTNFNFRALTVPGQQFVVEWTGDFTQWIPVATNVATGSSLDFNSSTANDRGFFRTRNVDPAP